MLIFNSVNTTIFDPELSEWMSCKDEKYLFMQRRQVRHKFDESGVETQFNSFQMGIKIQCPDDYEYIFGKCYKIVKEQKTWHEARDDCINRGGKLAEPESPCVSDLLHYFLQVIAALDGGSEHFAYIGVNDEWTEDSFVFDSNQKEVSYKYWSNASYHNVQFDQPDNYGGNEDCVVLSARFRKGYWNDQRCNRKHWFICEKSTPAPWG